MSAISKLHKGSHIHLMGICGTAMASLAGMLQDMGYKITGSDQNVYPPMSTQLEEMGIKILEGYRPENIGLDETGKVLDGSLVPDLVIVGNVISRHFPEAAALLNSDTPYTSLPAALGEFAIGRRNSIVLAGTHGKTTSTSMMAWVAECCGLKPGFLIGGLPENFHRSFRAPEAESGWFVIEGDEYDTAFFDKVPKFVHYRPKYVVLTSVEFDHADIYSSLDDIMVAFEKLMKLIPEDGVLVYNGMDENVCALAEKCGALTKISYGLETTGKIIKESPTGVSNGASNLRKNKFSYKAVDRKSMVGRNQFSVEHKGERIADLALKLFGEHNTLNALGVFALAHSLGWKEREVLQAFATFKGVKRRQQVIGEPNGITIVEDFAHHPTAVGLTIESMGEQYPGRRVLAVYEPRSATSRRNVFEQDYIQALSKAAIVFLPPAFNQDSIAEGERFSSARVVEAISTGKVDSPSTAILCKDVDDIVHQLKAYAKPGDVVLLMSNGGFGGIYQKLLSELSH